MAGMVYGLVAGGGCHKSELAGAWACAGWRVCACSVLHVPLFACAYVRVCVCGGCVLRPCALVAVAYCAGWRVFLPCGCKLVYASCWHLCRVVV